MNFRLPLTFLLLLAALWPASSSHSFSFSEDEQQEPAGESHSRQVSLTSLHCPPSLKKARIATMIGEIHKEGGHDSLSGSFLSLDSPDRDRRFGTRKSMYGNLVDDLNRGFMQLGLKTYTSEEINAQVAREEQEAFLNNNLDAAISAAERLRADFMLKGVISTRTQVNRVVNVDEVFVTINLVLVDRNGRQISNAMVTETTFSDADVLTTIQKIVQKQSHEITYQLFREYCRGGK